MASPPLPGDVETPPLQRAAFLGNLDQFKRLVKEVERGCQGENIGEALGKLVDGNGCTVLHMGAVNGKIRICKYLIKDLKVDVDVRDGRGTTPLHQAILGCQYPTAVYLLENGANINATSKEGFTPLHFAAKEGFKKLIMLLISRGAEINAMCHSGTPLQMAADGGKKDCVKILLDNHADPNAIHYRMFSPLVEAVFAHSIECVKLLLQAGADPNIRSDKVTPLEVAVGEKETEIIKCLLAAGANPNIRNGFDLSPLEIAAIEGQHEDVLVLFPATSPIAGITDWSPAGITKYVHTDEAKTKRENKRKETFLLAKSKGEAAFRRQDYTDAIYYNSECHGIEPSDATILSNRSLCWAMLNEGDRALSDAQACRSLRPNWPKAFYREGVAWKLLKDYRRAASMFLAGWQLDNENKELESALLEAVFLQVKSTKLSGGNA